MTTVREVGRAGPSARRYIVARAADVPPGGRLLVEVDGREIGVFNIGGEYYALLNRCPHRAGPLCEGDAIRLVTAAKVGELVLDDRVMLTCPWHAWEFDIKTGQSWWDPAKTRGRRFPIEVESGDAVATELRNDSAEWVRGPYVADVIETAVEEDYVIVTMRQQIARSESDASV
jgi:nitrite reductase/ring-hydroxylating ferredoxin subunit